MHLYHSHNPAGVVRKTRKSMWFETRLSEHWSPVCYFASFLFNARQCSRLLHSQSPCWF